MALRLLPLGRLTRRRNPLAMYNVDYTYTDIATEAGKTTSQIASVNNDGVITSYTYDTVGNITSETTGNQTISYTYDARNQLTGVTGGDKVYAYTYDGNGNLLTAQKGSVTNTYTYGDTTWKDLLTAYNGQTITYDEIGNPLTYRDGITFTWENGRQLASFTKNNNTVNFIYGADGSRVGKNNVEYVYIDGVLHAQRSGDTIISFMYDEKGSPYGFTHLHTDDLVGSFAQATASGDHYYYQYNLQGDVVGLMDLYGNQVAYYTYDPWGQPLSVTDADGNAITSATHIANLNPIRYRGYHYDTETGLYYVSSRYYDPEVGRWINADGYVSTGQDITGYNMFAYCGNNSVIRVDRGGEFWDTIFDVVSLVASVVDVVRNPSDSMAWAGLAGDTADLFPFVTGVGELVKTAKTTAKVADKASDTLKVAKRGWSVGDDITTLTKSGKEPSWNTVRSRYWKNQATLMPGSYSPENIPRMLKGRAPLVLHNGKLYPMELHHKVPRHKGGSNAFENLLPVTPWEHAAIDEYRHFKP